MIISFEDTFLDFPSADDIAVIVFMSGCEHHCLGCQNPEAQKLHEILSVSQNKKVVEELITRCKRNETKKIVLSGGDCLHPCNIDTTRFILKELGKEYQICIYTGYSIEEVKEMNISGFTYIKCGTFDINNKQESEKTDEYIQFINPTQNLFDSNYNQISKNGRFYFNMEKNND